MGRGGVKYGEIWTDEIIKTKNVNKLQHFPGIFEEDMREKRGEQSHH